MAFEITSFTYAAERKLSTINKFVSQQLSSDEGIKKYQYNPVPYDISFQLSIMVKNTEDGTMIVEQILPFFTPEWTTTVRMVDEPEIILDIPLYLTNVALEDTYEGDFNDRKAIIWTLDFTMKGFFFGPTKKTGVIKLANVNFYDSTLYDDIADAKGNASVTSRITIYPGLTANGEPTTDSSNTVPYSEISSTDNWDYIIELSGPILEE